MKKIFFAFTFVSSIFSCEIIWNNGPTQLLKDIFHIMDVNGVGNIETAVQQSNFRWLRPKGLERWDVYSFLDFKQRAELTRKIKYSGLAKEKIPLQKHYDAIIILGATTSRVKSRIAFFNKIYKQGITCNKIYLLGSTRDLKIGTDLDKKMAQVLEAKNLDPTEMNMMKNIWQKVVPNLPESITIVAIQSGRRPDGTRANTEDTLKDMLEDFGDAEGKSFLFISSNPYICYQDAVEKKVLIPYGAIVETVGEAMNKNETMENVLDTVARCLTNIKGMSLS